ncbi:MAG TPA: hypothetical protein VGA27_10465 [Candidatus Binatia bacterium]
MGFSRTQPIATIRRIYRLANVKISRVLTSSAAIWILIAFMNAVSWSHEVGEPELEKLSIWRHCCNEHDCIPQPVSILRKEEYSLLVDIAGAQASVDAYKFADVPSSRTWVCYVVPNGNVSNDNIRCILRPKLGGVT